MGPYRAPATGKGPGNSGRPARWYRVEHRRLIGNLFTLHRPRDFGRCARASPICRVRRGKSRGDKRLRSGGVALGRAQVALDQRLRELPLSTAELAPVRLELAAARVTLAQRL